MEPENRPYVDADTEPGDEGTEEWADTPGGSSRRWQRPARPSARAGGR